MSKEGMNALIEKMKTDEDFKNQVLATDGMDARIKLVNEAGFDVDEEDVKEAFDLSDAELQQAAGGNQDSQDNCNCVCHCYQECKKWT